MAQQATAAPAQQRRTVICLGDSHTRGFLGASWINLLRPQFPQLRFINAGNDGEPSERILARLPGLLKAHPDPAAVLIFSGSNDCIAQETEDLQQYYKWWFWLSQRCSQQYALDNKQQMLQMVQEKAPQAKVSPAAAHAAMHCGLAFCWYGNNVVGSLVCSS
jgi:lysophospholipase L1-like esterase